MVKKAHQRHFGNDLTPVKELKTFPAHLLKGETIECYSTSYPAEFWVVPFANISENTHEIILMMLYLIEK